jgi:type III secretion protein L
MAAQMMEITAKSVRKFSHFEEAILNIVMRSLRRVIGEIDDTELIRRIVTNALEVVRNQKRATLRVNPDQAPAVRKSVAEWTKKGSQIELMEVVADSRIGKEACLIETEIGTVDASLDVQLTAIRRVLSKAFSLE